MFRGDRIGGVLYSFEGGCICVDRLGDLVGFWSRVFSVFYVIWFLSLDILGGFIDELIGFF